MKLFSLDSPFGRAVALIADLVILNLLFLLSCIPVITIGAACGAMYDTVHAMLTGDCAAVSRQYSAGFKKCFKRGTVLFLISVAALAMVLFDLLCALQLEGIMGIACLGVVTASLVLVLGVMAVLPMAVCRNPDEPVRELIRESFLLALKGTWRTAAALVLNALPFFLFYFTPVLFLQTWMFWFLLGFGALGYVNNWLLLKPVDPRVWEEIRPVRKKA